MEVEQLGIPGLEVLPAIAAPVRKRPRHTCHRPGCDVSVPPRMLACPPDWKMLPGALRRRIWAAYVPGQELRKDPSPAYLEAALACERWWQENAS